MNETITLADGATLGVRPIEPEDAPRLAEMFERLSPTTVYRRFFSPIARPRAATLAHLARVDHRHREAVVALDGERVVAVARYEGRSGSPVAEVAVTVEDAWQGRGLGPKLVRRLGRLAYRQGLEGFTVTMMSDNHAAIELLHRVAPGVRLQWDDGAYAAYAPLRDGRSATR
jgi:GNAT superfamily N-acetyltransferase